MKLLVVIHSLHSGGAERVTANLVNSWAATGVHVTVATITPDLHDFYTLHPTVRRLALDLAGGSTNALSGAFNNIKRVVALRQVLLETKPDVAIGMMTSANVLLSIASTSMPHVRTVLCEHTYPPQLPVSRIWSRIRRWTYPMADRVVMLTAEGLGWLQTEIPRAKGAVIPNPIPYPLPVNEPLISPDSVLPRERKMLLAVGRLSEEKGVDKLVQAFSALANRHTQWDLIILGEGPLRDALNSQVHSLGLSARVALPGRAGNIGSWYERADIYAMSSRVEGFPNTLGEAMAHGCAAVSFDCDTGPRDLIRHEIDGILVPPGNVESLTHALDRLMKDEALRTNFATRAIEVRERYSTAHVLGLWEKLIQEIPSRVR